MTSTPGVIETLARDSRQHHLQRILAKQARSHVVMADHTKFGRSGNCRTLPWSAVGVLVTDQEPDDDYREALEAAGVELLLPHTEVR